MLDRRYRRLLPNGLPSKRAPLLVPHWTLLGLRLRGTSRPLCVCVPSPLKLARADGSVAIFFTLLDFSLAPEGAGAEFADVTSTLSNQSHHVLFTALGTGPLDTPHDPTISHGSSGGRTRVASSSPLPRAPELSARPPSALLREGTLDSDRPHDSGACGYTASGTSLGTRTPTLQPADQHVQDPHRAPALRESPDGDLRIADQENPRPPC